MIGRKVSIVRYSETAFKWLKHIYTDRLRRFAHRTGLHSRINIGFWEICFLFAEQPLRLKTHTDTIRTVMRSDGSLASYPEQYVVEEVIQDIEPGDVFFDIGANIGRYTIPVALLSPKIETVAFEPDQRNIGILQQNAELNDVTITVLNTALSDSDGEMDLILSDNPGRNRLAHSADDGGEKKENILVSRGDTLIQNGEIPEPDVIKIDVEGAETEVLNGLAETLADGDCRAIYCEVHPNLLADAGSSADHFRERLHPLGFDVTTINERQATFDGQVRQPFIKATRQPSN